MSFSKKEEKKPKLHGEHTGEYKEDPAEIEETADSETDIEKIADTADDDSIKESLDKALNEDVAKATEESTEVPEGDVKVKEKKTFSRKQLILAVVIAVLVMAVICVGIVSYTSDINPISYSIAIITNDADALVGKWQSQDSPGLSAYVFYEDGDYDSYISTYSFSGSYTTSGNILTLRNTSTGQSLTYEYSVSNDVLTLTTIAEEDDEIEDANTVKFDRVDTLNQKSLSDLVGDLAGSVEEEDEDEDE